MFKRALLLVLFLFVFCVGLSKADQVFSITESRVTNCSYGYALLSYCFWKSDEYTSCKDVTTNFASFVYKLTNDNTMASTLEDSCYDICIRAKSNPILGLKRLVDYGSSCYLGR